MAAADYGRAQAMQQPASFVTLVAGPCSPQALPQVRRARMLACRAAPARAMRVAFAFAVVFIATSSGSITALAPRQVFCGGSVLHRSARGPSHAACRSVAQPEALQGTSTLNLVKAQVMAGHAMRDLGNRLMTENFEASTLDGKVKVSFDGTQSLRNVELAAGSAEAAGGNEALAKAILGAMQEAHDSSLKGSQDDVWKLYKGSPELMQAPLSQIGAGNTVEDLWANVSRTDDSVRLAEELFTRFDQDKDDWWNLHETSQVQMATEGTEMAEEAFNSLIIAAAPDGGRRLTEEDMAKGLSRDQVIELYTNAQRQRQLGFVLDIYKDHAKVFNTEPEASPESAPSLSVD
ncbi:unnamed protein product [Polarella glacialis]|uniref:Uncharacterized protein n=1 Tax=Polarella glacialis TaxID=89957 RepID=A0A813I7A6_POLGL|nr:unnamed protein product [Polarella glacialis]CAE8645658.1 unnamed protein product [Polarella glacialis]